MRNTLVAAVTALIIASPAAATTTIIFESSVSQDFEFGGNAQFINGTLTFNEAELASEIFGIEPQSSVFSPAAIFINADILDANGVSLFALDSQGGAFVEITDGVTSVDQVLIDGGVGTYLDFQIFLDGMPNAFTGLDLDVLSRITLSDFPFTQVVATIIGVGGVSATLTRFEVIPPTTAVPLPASLPLLLAGLGAFGALRFRRARAD